MSDQPRLRPIGLLASILYFGIPCAVFSASILGLLPWMKQHGYSDYVLFNVTFGGPLILMLIAAIVAYRLEGRPWTWAAFRDRMRLTRPTGRDWLWTIALVASGFLLPYLLNPLAEAVSGVTFYTPPKEFGEFMASMRSGLGMDLRGRWDVFLWVVFALAVFNIGGEELWWRGIILPRQELALGKWAWLVNGLLWDLFHFFYHSNLGSVVGYLAATVPLAYVAQRTRNTWPGIIAHLIGNGAVPLVILMKVLGK